MAAASAGLRVECRARMLSAALLTLALFACSGMTSHAMTGVGGTSAGSTAAVGGGSGSVAPAGRSGSPAVAGVGGTADSAAGAAGNATWSSQPLAAAPSYMGSKDGSSGCTTSYATTGFEPVDTSGKRHPLFLYFVGTRFVDSDQSARYDCQAAKQVTEAMARRGFVALSVDYDNRQAGLSSARVPAVWTTGYGGNAAAKLPVNRLRVVNAQGDTMNSAHDTLTMAAGFSAAECPDDGRKQCLRADGSGYIIVQTADCQLTAGDHCWFDKLSCTASGETLEPNWIDPKSTKAFALESNADWLARTLQRP